LLGRRRESYDSIQSYLASVNETLNQKKLSAAEREKEKENNRREERKEG
jgi:hypothetical protein